MCETGSLHGFTAEQVLRFDDYGAVQLNNLRPLPTLRVWGSGAATNVAGKRYFLAALPASTVSGSASQSEYVAACSALGLRPVVTGFTAYDALRYCAEAWDCLQTMGGGQKFWPTLGARTGWVHACDTSETGVGGGCEGPTLAAFSPYDIANGERYGATSGGGLMNSVGGPIDLTRAGWGGAVHLVCGGELP